MTEAAPQQQNPPWQVRWKRPQWDRVVLGMDAADFDSEHHDDNDNDNNNENDNNGNGHGSDGREHQHHDNEYELIGADNLDAINESWIPISNSSVALTKKEARVAIMELHRQDRLLVRRRRRRRGRGHGNEMCDDGEEKKERDEAVQNQTLTPTKNNERMEEPTPKNKNTKAIRRTTSPLPLSRSTTTKTNNHKREKDSKANQSTIVEAATSSSAAAATASTPISPPPKSLTSPSTWFKSLTSPGTRSTSSKPPRISPAKPSSNNANHPHSPTSFSTFNVTTPPPKPFPNLENSPEENENSPESPPTMMDASHASSLLWEDMTLTSVSEEDAVAFRLYGNQRATIHEHHEGGGGGGTNKAKKVTSVQMASKEAGGGRSGGGESSHSTRTRLFHGWNDWDGFDNVVLSVSIFSTTTAGSANNENNEKARPGAGEVVVMELLSTKNPPLPSNEEEAINTPSRSKARQRDKSHNKLPVASSSPTNSSSNSSSLTSSLSASAPPPPPPTSSSSKGGGSLASISGEDDSTTSTSTTKSKQTKQSSKYGSLGKDDEEEKTSNHTRILARRVLWWPSYVRSQGNGVKSKSGKGGVSCLSFVSLGRTSVWKERKPSGEEQPVGDIAKDSLNNEDECDDGDMMHGQHLLNDDDNDGDVEDVRNEEQGTTQAGAQKQQSPGQNDRAADAMDALQSLNFLFGGGELSALADPSKKAANENSTSTSKKGKTVEKGGAVASNGANPNQQKKLTQPLSMCLVSSNGHVHFYSALRVLASNNDNSRNNSKTATALGDLSNSFAAFLLGSELFHKMNDGVMPLSQPRATIRLSQVVSSVENDKGSRSVKKREQQQRQACDDGYQYAYSSDDPASWKRFLRQSGPTDDNVDPTDPLNEEQQQHRGRYNWASLRVFDASIDPSSLPLRTVPQTNVLTGTCITSDTDNAYLATCGKGLRRIKENRYQSYVLGGFVTFVSLRHCAESRTIYLPFAPHSIQPMYWMGMHFVVLLGEEGSPGSLPSSSATGSNENDKSAGLDTAYWGSTTARGEIKCRPQRRRPCVMAVRVDCKRGRENSGMFSSVTDSPLDLGSSQHYMPLFGTKPVGLEHSDSVFMSSPPPVVAREGNVVASTQPLVTEDGRRNISHPSRFQCIPISLPSVHESLGSLSEFLATGDGQSSPFPQLLMAREDKGRLNNAIIHSKAIAISSIPSSPPGIVLSYQCLRSTTMTEEGERNNSQGSLIIVNHTLCPFQTNSIVPGYDGVSATAPGAISLSTLVRPGHRFLLDAAVELGKEHSAPQRSAAITNVWCTGGQGWSLLGTQETGHQNSYFVCWDGATDDSQGPFILPFQLSQTASKHNSRPFCLASGVMPLTNFVKHMEKSATGSFSHGTTVANKKMHSSSKAYSLPSFLHQDDTMEGGAFPTGYAVPKRSFSVTLKESIKMAADLEGGLDEIIVNALASISAPRHQSPESRAKTMIGGSRAPSSRSKALMMSHKEKSKRLLRQCSSWTQLDNPNHGIVHGQVIVATILIGTQFQSLTLRTNVITNPITTPFNQVLSWLCSRRDYYTAASVALSLLNDAEAVYELCGITKNSAEDEWTYHRGLLDGIKPLGDNAAHENIAETMTSLADMAVGCLIKGGVSMSKTLEGFLVRNTLYNAPRACLMLVGATTSTVSNDSTPKQNLKKDGNIMDMLSTLESPSEDLIWPVRCLVKMAVVRNCLATAILMLNATIPNELRWRAPKSRGLATATRPSLELFLALVDVILESSSDKATRYLLNMMDEETGVPYWFSIEEDTKLALSLISIRGKHLFLCEPEVRAWALERLKEEIESPTDTAYNVEGLLLPDGWLKEVVTGAFCNAGCDIGLGLDAMLMGNSASKSEPSKNEEFVCYRQDMICVRDLLVPQQHSGGLDYDISIAALLILARRGQDWRDGTQISTQTLLNTVCDMAGRKTDGEPKFIFDGAIVMRQCALADNLQAASFLIGGKKGLVLECADLVVSDLAMTVKDAEMALFIGSLAELKRAMASMYERVMMQDKSAFSPNISHKHLMWLLEEHVLNVHTYGEFDSSSHSGAIDPVSAGRVCFRAWYCLTHPSILGSSAKWLEEWLRRKLELTNGRSPKRLACAALVRTLLWADETEELDLNDGNDDEPLLAAVIGFDGKFMAELAQACCGLIQSIPPHLAEELMSSFGSSNYSIEASFLSSAQ